MSRITGICSLYEPLAFLANRIRNLNQCDLSDTSIFFADCSSELTWNAVKAIIESDCKFKYQLHHFDERTTLYYTWAWVVDRTKDTTVYFCNTNVDDIQEPTYHKKMAEFLDQHLGVEIVACPWLITEIKGQIWPPNAQSASGPNVDRTMGHFPMWRASLHRAGLNFDQRMVAIGDSFFWSAVKKQYGRSALAILDEQLSCYLSHENNLYYTAKGPQGQNGEAYDRCIGPH